MIRVNDIKDWLPAKGPKLSDHDWGDLCKDKEGNLYLIGDAFEDSDSDQGCGCCADRINDSDIIEYISIIKYEKGR